MTLGTVDELMPANTNLGCGQAWSVGSRIHNIPPARVSAESKVMTSETFLPAQPTIESMGTISIRNVPYLISIVRSFLVLIMPVTIAVKLGNLPMAS